MKKRIKKVNKIVKMTPYQFAKERHEELLDLAFWCQEDGGNKHSDFGDAIMEIAQELDAVIQQYEK